MRQISTRRAELSQRSIPCLFMRGGTSKGPFLDMRDLPTDAAARDRVLLAIMGSPDERQIDGLGGADFVTSKAVMVAPSERDGIDVDYLFAQVLIDQPLVDTRPPCGNMIAGVGPFAIETGMVDAVSPETTVRIYNINTATTIEALVRVADGRVVYGGETAIDGVPGTAAPVVMNFSEFCGGKTGRLFSTGKARETIDEVEVTLIDAAMPMMHVAAESLGLSGGEDRSFFEDHPELMERLEAMRLEAGRRMGFGDVHESVIPKIAILSTAVAGGSIRSRYLTPHSLHPAHAVTGGIAIATAAVSEGTIASELARLDDSAPATVTIEHPSGSLEVRIDRSEHPPTKAGVVRTARKIMSGEVFVPSSLWQLEPTAEPSK